jgi:hypothetical protein
MTLKEKIKLILKEETKKKLTDSYVVFVSGWEKNMSHNDQTAKFTSSFNKNHIVKSFRYTETKLIRDFLNEKKDKVKAIILYSAAYTLVNKLNFPSNKTYCIEPWNGYGSDANTRDNYNSIPKENMYIDYESYARGKGTKVGANKTNHKDGHFVALTTSSADISKKVE